MKLYDEITSHQYCLIYTDYGYYMCDISREEEEYQQITFSRKLTISDLRKMQDEDDIGAYDAIRVYDGDEIERIETIEEYNAVTEDGEEIRIFVPDMWI